VAEALPIGGASIHTPQRGEEITFPKYRVLKEVRRSFTAGSVSGRWVCGTWTFLGTNPMPIFEKPDTEVLST
jgi:hypothetical protein